MTSGVYHRLPPFAEMLWERWEPNRVNFDSVCGNLPNENLRGGQRLETNAVANAGVFHFRRYLVTEVIQH